MIAPGSLATLISQTQSNAAAGGAISASAAHAMNMGEIDKASKDFEAMSISQMLDQMGGDSLGVEAFGDSETNEIYKSLMMDAYGKKIADAGGIGIAAFVKRELLKLQEV